MKNLSLRLPEELLTRLERASHDQGQAKSDVVRKALEAYLSEHKSAGRLSCTDLAGDIVGSLTGASDLASNPKRMTGYGR